MDFNLKIVPLFDKKTYNSSLLSVFQRDKTFAAYAYKFLYITCASCLAKDLDLIYDCERLRYLQTKFVLRNHIA